MLIEANVQNANNTVSMYAENEKYPIPSDLRLTMILYKERNNNGSATVRPPAFTADVFPDSMVIMNRAPENMESPE